jgi:hypothetical protein
MKVYHGVPSPSKMERCRESAPSHEHGAEWLPDRMTDHGWPWILDNGVYNGNFHPGAWSDGLSLAQYRMSNAPDFVVLPDVWQDWKATKQRHEIYAQWVPDDWPIAAVAQPGGSVEDVVRFAVDIGAETLFIGGGREYRLKYADQLVMTAHDYGLRAHIGQPGSSLSWAQDVGADSVDTTSIVRNGYWDRLRKLEAADPGTQLELGADGGHCVQPDTDRSGGDE